MFISVLTHLGQIKHPLLIKTTDDINLSGMSTQIPVTTSLLVNVHIISNHVHCGCFTAYYKNMKRVVSVVLKIKNSN